MKRNLRPNQVRFRRAVKTTAIATLAALATLFAGIKIGQNQEKKNTEKVLVSKNEAEKRAAYFQNDAANLALQNIGYKRFAEEAQALADSMTFYPTEPDSISALPEEEQEKVGQKVLEEDAKNRKKHDDTLASLGVDTNLLFRVKQGPQIGD